MAEEPLVEGTETGPKEGDEVIKLVDGGNKTIGDESAQHQQHIEEGKDVTGEEGGGEHVEGEQVRGEDVEGEQVEGEHIENELMEGEQVEGEHVEGEHVKGEHEEVEHMKGEHVEGEELMGEELEGEGLEGEETEGEEKKEGQEPEEQVEEEQFVEEPPPDPAAPFDFSDSKEALKPLYQLRPDQLAEVEQLWELYQNYTPAYTDIDEYITEKELIYMLKGLLLMTYTPEQLQELIIFCVRPPHAEGHITYEQFLKMVTLRQRDFPIEEELRAALQVMDPDKTGTIDREYLKEVLSKQGYKLPQKLLDNLIKEVDMSNDGTIGIEDVVGTLGIDLNRDDIVMLMNAINPPDVQPEPEQF